MNFKILAFVGLFAASFVAAVIWKMDSFIATDRSSWAQAQMRTQVSSVQQSLESSLKNLYRLSGAFLENRRDKNFWTSVEPFKAMGWIRDIKNPTLENVSVKEGSGLDDTSLAMAMKELQGLKTEKQKISLIPWKDAQRKNWVILVWPWSESRYLVLWTGPEFLQASLENFKGSLSQLMLINENGQILAHDEAEYFASRVTDHPLFVQFKEDGAKQGGSTYQDSKGQTFLGHLTVVPRSNLLAIATSSQHLLLSDKNKIWASFLFLGLGFVLFMLAGLAFLNRASKQEDEMTVELVPPTQWATAPVPTVAPIKTDGLSLAANAAGPMKTAPSPGASTGEERQIAYKKIASSLGHELRGPLARILGFCQMILSKEKNPEVSAHIDSILRETRSARELLDKLFSFAQEKDESTAKVKMSSLIQNVLARVQPTITRKNIRLVKDISDATEVHVSAIAVEKALENILQNSIEALDRKTQKEIKVKLQKIPNAVQVTIEDNGEGIDPANLTKVFDPFFTTRSYANHLGLGLSAAYGVVHQHGGDIKVESERGQSTKIILTFPEGEVARVAEAPKIPVTPVASRVEPISFSPADVEIEKLMDMAENEAPSQFFAEQEDKTVAIPTSAVPSAVSAPTQASPKLDKAHIFVERPKSALDDYQVQIRRPRQNLTES